MQPMAIDAPKRPVGQSLLRGLVGRCPHCGKGKMFYAYLKVNEACSVCGHNLDQYPSDDGPAYFTILIVGHLVVAPLLVLSFVWRASLWIVVPGTVIPLAVITLLVLPRIKGAVVGALYAFRVTRDDGFAHTADRAE
jgi:uncharacterized protein (DUF983 family)